MSASANRAPLRDAALVAGAKLLVSLVVLATGFRALSDDDYARIVIAQRFAETPALDPSGTSWLPLPFWVTGGAMAGLGRSVEVARGVAFVLGIASALLVWAAARWLGASRRGALVGGILGGAVPYSAWLGVAAVPEGPTAALMLLGAAAAASAEPRRRLAGAAALGAACLSRYEAWPAAAAFAALCLWDARQLTHRLAFAVAALLAVATPSLWVLHGLLAHGDPLFFVARVAEYRRAVSSTPVSLLGSLFRYPLALLRSEPELAALTAVAVAVAARDAPGALALRRFARPALLLFAVLVGLVLADLRDGAPTHHAERTLLSLWLLASIVAGEALAIAWSARTGRQRKRLAALALSSVALGSLGIRPFFARRDSFIDRSEEIAVGREARALTIAPRERLLVDTPDFGYFAVLAGYARPLQAAPLHDRDPRRPRPDPLVNEPIPRLAASLAAERARYLVTARARAGLTAELGPVRAATSRFIVIEVSAAPRKRP